MTAHMISVEEARRVVEYQSSYDLRTAGEQTLYDYAHTVVVQAERIVDLEQRLAAGVAQAEVARGGGTSIVLALTGDPGAVVEADPYGRSADA